jgi:poly(hydroxyalkanoate) granule-associated protein
MSDLFRKTILAGLGALSLSREKVEELTKELIERGELSKTDEATFVKDLLDIAEKNKTGLEEKVEKAVEKVLTRLDIPTRKELSELKEELGRLTKKTR